MMEMDSILCEVSRGVHT